MKTLKIKLLLIAFSIMISGAAVTMICQNEKVMAEQDFVQTNSSINDVLELIGIMTYTVEMNIHTRRGSKPGLVLWIFLLTEIIL